MLSHRVIRYHLFAPTVVFSSDLNMKNIKINLSKVNNFYRIVKNMFIPKMRGQIILRYE